MLDDRLLQKLSENFDDFKERLIRIEEGLKFVRGMEEDVDEAKKAAAKAQETANAAMQSVRSAHKRVDGTENNQTWLWRTVVSSIVIGGIGLMFFIVQLFLKGGGS